MTERFRGAIVSVGGSEEPIAKTLNEGRPRYVLFFVSPLSKPQVEEKILPRLAYNPIYNVVSTSDAEDFAVCYEAIRDAIPGWLEERNLQAAEVFVDITGGFKPMSAALGLAGAERFSHFTYISGRERTKDGLGTVISGTEQVLRTVNPWDKLASREKERASWLYRHGQPGEAAEVLRQSATKCGPELQEELRTIAELMDLFAGVDSFDFHKLTHDWGRLQARLRLVFRDGFKIFEQLERCVDVWKTVQCERQVNGTHPATFRELLANAERRSRQSKYDDAVARLYRATELFVHDRLFEAFGYSEGRIPLSQIPEQARAGLRDEAEIVKCGVKDGFWLLGYSQDPRHREISNGWEILKNHLTLRNSSILAHGLQAASEGQFQCFWEALLCFVKANEQEMPRWPEMEL